MKVSLFLRLSSAAFACGLASTLPSGIALAQGHIPFASKAERETLLLPKTEREAMFIANCAFRTVTKNEIDDYLIQIVDKSNTKEWVFFILGQGPFARPGNSWDVRVNRISGKTTISRGI